MMARGEKLLLSLKRERATTVSLIDEGQLGLNGMEWNEIEASERVQN